MKHRADAVACRHFAVPVNGLAVVLDELHVSFFGKASDGRYHRTVYEDRYAKVRGVTAPKAHFGGFWRKTVPTRVVPRIPRKSATVGFPLQKVKPAIIAEIIRLAFPVAPIREAVLPLLPGPQGSWQYVFKQRWSALRF